LREIIEGIRQIGKEIAARNGEDYREQRTIRRGKLEQRREEIRGREQREMRVRLGENSKKNQIFIYQNIKHPIRLQQPYISISDS